jgi:cysteine-rich repeat protein
VGMFGMRQVEPSAALQSLNQGAAGLLGGSFADTGPQIRGFGYTHEASLDTMFRFFSVGGFSMNTTQEAEMSAYLNAFDSDLAPTVGQQVTLTSTNSGTAGPRVSLLMIEANTDFTSQILGGQTKQCNLVAKVVEGGMERGYLYTGGGTFQPDDGGATINDATLRAKANTVGQEVTYTCVPPGAGNRAALDRDQDTLLDGVETNTGIFVSSSDTGTSPSLVDTDGDTFDDDDEVNVHGTDPTNPLSFPGAPACGDGVVESPEQCDDNNTLDGDCCSSTCQWESAASSCDDGNACTPTDTCDGAGTCTGSGSLVCNDANACTDDSCDSGTGCVFANNTNSCDDSDTCTTGDACSAGTCAAGGTLDCDDGDPCTADSCDALSGCGHEPILVGVCAPAPEVPSFTGTGHAALILFVLAAGAVLLLRERRPIAR